jgi:hypothetical protein
VASRPEEVGHQVVHVPGRKLLVLLLMREKIVSKYDVARAGTADKDEDDDEEEEDGTRFTTWSMLCVK